MTDVGTVKVFFITGNALEETGERARPDGGGGGDAPLPREGGWLLRGGGGGGAPLPGGRGGGSGKDSLPA